MRPISKGWMIFWYTMWTWIATVVSVSLLVTLGVIGSPIPSSNKTKCYSEAEFLQLPVTKVGILKGYKDYTYRTNKVTIGRHEDQLLFTLYYHDGDFTCEIATFVSMEGYKND